MQYAQIISSMVLSLRRKVSMKVRQPLNKIMIPILDVSFEKQLEAIKHLVLTEVNVKEMEFLHESSNVLVKKIKANFKSLGPKYGKLMKAIAQEVALLDQKAISQFEKDASFSMSIEGQDLQLTLEDSYNFV